jgi:hypothetical protein
MTVTFQCYVEIDELLNGFEENGLLWGSLFIIPILLKFNPSTVENSDDLQTAFR